MNWENLFSTKKNSKLIVQITIGVILSLISFVIFAKLADTVFENEKIYFDGVIVQYIYSFRNAFNTKLMIIVSDFGYYGVVLLSILISGFLAVKKYFKLSAYFIFIVGSGFIANFLLKILVQRPRPTLLPLVYESDFSFPSGHTMGSFIFFITLAYLYYHLTKKKATSIVLFFIFMFITLLIGISRIYLGVHYPSDILGAFFAGFLWFVGITTVNKTFKLLKINRN